MVQQNYFLDLYLSKFLLDTFSFLWKQKFKSKNLITDLKILLNY